MTYFPGHVDDVLGGERRRSERASNLNLFHAFRRLVFFFVRVIVRIVTVQFARLAFAFDAVGVRRTDERAAREIILFSARMKKKSGKETYAY